MGQDSPTHKFVRPVSLLLILSRQSPQAHREGGLCSPQTLGFPPCQKNAPASVLPTSPKGPICSVIQAHPEYTLGQDPRALPPAHRPQNCPWTILFSRCSTQD